MSMPAMLLPERKPGHIPSVLVQCRAFGPEDSDCGEHSVEVSVVLRCLDQASEHLLFPLNTIVCGRRNQDPSHQCQWLRLLQSVHC